jgi:hypothetical protein
MSFQIKTYFSQSMLSGINWYELSSIALEKLMSWVPFVAGNAIGRNKSKTPICQHSWLKDTYSAPLRLQTIRQGPRDWAEAGSRLLPVVAAVVPPFLLPKVSPTTVRQSAFVEAEKKKQVVRKRVGETWRPARPSKTASET